MPDLLTHVTSGYLVRQITAGRLHLGVLTLGVILPDVVTRPVYIIWPEAYWFVKPLHTPLGLVLLSVAVSGFFAARDRRQALINLLAGNALHLALDLLQKHLVGGYALLFPFTWRSWEIGLVWPEQTLIGLPVWLGVALIVYFYGRKKTARAG